jgi:LETM1 and EF-hand domain-containing protein 1
MVRGVATGTRDLALNPSKIPPLLRATWTSIKDEAYHYWLGTKLLWSEMKLASAIIKRILQGHAMTRRERMQLIRTAMDMFRLVPFAIFVIVPFMELLLPVALKLFPNMLPSTFTDSLKREENMKKELQMRIAIAGFFQETVHTMAAEKHKKLKGGDTGAQEIISFFEKVRLGEQLPNHLVIKMAQLFEDELMLPNIQRPQLVSMCQYMGLAPYGAG